MAEIAPAWHGIAVEPPVTRAGLAANAARAPHAARVAVELLRSIDGLPVASALVLESLTYAMLQGSAEHVAWRDVRAATSVSPPGEVLLRRGGDVLHVTIDRPAARNAIDCAIRDGLHAAFSVAAADPDIARVMLRATGAAFSVGADLGEFGTTCNPATAHRIRMATLPAWPLSVRPEIVAVHVQGACIGAGLELAAFAGRVTAAPSAWFQLPELAMGLIPGAGGCVSVPRRIGWERTALMILSGRRINARTALDWGLIDAIVEEAPVDPGRADGD